MITTKQRAHLRGLGSVLDPVMQVGKEGLTDNSYTAIDGLLDARELIKIKILKNCPICAKVASEQICQRLGADPVQTIGAMVVVYRKSKKQNFEHIQLPQ